MNRESFLDYLLSGNEQHEDEANLMSGPVGPWFQSVPVPFCERPIFNSGYDVFGVHWTRAIPASHHTQGQEPVLTDILNWREELRFPKVERYDWDWMKSIAQNVDRDNKVIVTTMLLGPFERLTTLCSFEDALVNMFSEPEECAALALRIADYKIEVIDHIHRAAHPDVLNLHDDWGTGTNTFISVDLWRQIIKPATERIYAAIRERGMIVGQHSCGHITPLLDDAIDMGMQIWEAQAEANDLPALKEKYRGRLRILQPAIDSLYELGATTTEETPEPPLDSLPLTIKPYPEKPVPLWE